MHYVFSPDHYIGIVIASTTLLYNINQCNYLGVFFVTFCQLFFRYFLRQTITQKVSHFMTMFTHFQYTTTEYGSGIIKYLRKMGHWQKLVSYSYKIFSSNNLLKMLLITAFLYKNIFIVITYNKSQKM